MQAKRSLRLTATIKPLPNAYDNVINRLISDHD
jgi:hypothetical protein